MKLPTLLLLASALSASAQYTIDWFTVDGGGGQSSGGAYTLVGTLGQPDAVVATGGGYTLQGGFWSVFSTVPTQGAPTLHILPNGGGVLLAWPSAASGFVLQETSSLASPSWTDVSTVPGIVGDEKQVTLPLQPGRRYFRLRGP